MFCDSVGLFCSVSMCRSWMSSLPDSASSISDSTSCAMLKLIRSMYGSCWPVWSTCQKYGLRSATTRVTPPEYGSVTTHGSSVGFSALPHRDGISMSPHLFLKCAAQSDWLAALASAAALGLYFGWNWLQ